MVGDLATKARYSWWGKILAEHHTEPTELLLGGFLKWVVGTWLFLPFDTFSSSPTFASLDLFPEMAWAIFLMIFGAIHMGVLKQGSIHYRKYASFGGMLIWAALSFTFIVTNPPAFGSMLMLVAAISQGWCFIRLDGECDYQNIQQGITHGRRPE